MKRYILVIMSVMIVWGGTALAESLETCQANLMKSVITTQSATESKKASIFIDAKETLLKLQSPNGYEYHEFFYWSVETYSIQPHQASSKVNCSFNMELVLIPITDLCGPNNPDCMKNAGDPITHSYQTLSCHFEKGVTTQIQFTYKAPNPGFDFATPSVPLCQYVTVVSVADDGSISLSNIIDKNKNGLHDALEKADIASSITQTAISSLGVNPKRSTLPIEQMMKMIEKSPASDSANAPFVSPLLGVAPSHGKPVVSPDKIHDVSAYWSALNDDKDDADNNTDNCPFVDNPDQADSDGDGIGDACDSDYKDEDKDGIDDSNDNCSAVKNANQSDIDMDGIGDACDDDVDGDGWKGEADFCPEIYDESNACDFGLGGKICEEGMDCTGGLPPANGGGGCTLDRHATSTSPSLGLVIAAMLMALVVSRKAIHH